MFSVSVLRKSNGKPDKNVGKLAALGKGMSTSLDSIYKKMATTLEQKGGGHTEMRMDPARHISPVVAHELNNVIAVIMGYGERLLLKSNGDPAMEAHLKLIVEASRRAASIVRDATPQRPARLPGTTVANGTNGTTGANGAKGANGVATATVMTNS